MKYCASPNYHKARKQRLLERSIKGVEAKRKLRIKRAKECSEWKRYEYNLVFSVSSDGRHVGLQIVGNNWYRCGSERTIRSLLAKAIWNKTLYGKTNSHS